MIRRVATAIASVLVAVNLVYLAYEAGVVIGLGATRT